MKNLMLLIPLACILFASCSAEETTEPSLDQKSEAAYVFRLSHTNTWEASTTLDFGGKSNVSSVRNNGNSLHAHGDFAASGGQISFSGTQNNGGAHGSATFNIAFGPFGEVNVILETVNVISIGDNEVVYGGQISEIIENTVMFPPPPPGFPPPPCDRYDLGTYVYFAVKDNGQGVNAPLDQYSPFFINTCDEIPNIGNVPWSLFGWINVQSSDDGIKVND